MTTYFPLFPLEIVVFPGERLNLHIFEDRYKELINECFNTNKTFGIPAYINDELSEYGTEVEVTAIEKLYPDGKMDIRTKGLKLFRVIEFFPKAEEALYPAGIVSFNHDYTTSLLDSEAEPETVKNLKELLVHLTDILGISKKLIPSNEQYISFKIAHYLGMPIEEEYSLLLANTETQRQQRIIDFLEKVMPDIEHREEMRRKIQLNGHFKELKPPHF